jgi:hypothetical protein
VWYTQEEARHPTQTFLGEGTDIRQVGDIVQVGHPIATEAIKLRLRYLSYVGEYHHGLDETYQDGSRRFAAGLQQGATDVCRHLVREALLFLQVDKVYAYTWLMFDNSTRISQNPTPILQPEKDSLYSYLGRSFAKTSLRIEI